VVGDRPGVDRLQDREWWSGVEDYDLTDVVNSADRVNFNRSE